VEHQIRCACASTSSPNSSSGEAGRACLQETKCVDDAFPLKDSRRLGYEHVALTRAEGLPRPGRDLEAAFETTDIRTFCDKSIPGISRWRSQQGAAVKPLVLQYFYVPAGGDIRIRRFTQNRAQAPLPRRDEKAL